MPHSYDAVFAFVGRLLVRSFDAVNETATKISTRMIIVRIGRYCATARSPSPGRESRPRRRSTAGHSWPQVLGVAFALADGRAVGDDGGELLHHLVGGFGRAELVG